MEAQEAKRHIEKFETILKHIEMKTGLDDEEQVYHYLTTFKGKTASLKQIRDDSERRIESLKEEHKALEGARDGLVNRQVVSLDKMAAHLDRPIVNAEKRCREVHDKFLTTQRLVAEVGTALSFIKDKIAPIVPASILGAPGPSSQSAAGGPPAAPPTSTSGGIAAIAEDEELDERAMDAGGPRPPSSDGREREAAAPTGQGGEALAQMTAAERALTFAFDMISNPSLMEESAKPASRRRPTSLLSSMYTLREDSASTVSEGDPSLAGAPSPSLGSLGSTPSARRRSENVVKAASARERRSVYSSSLIGASQSASSSSASGEGPGSMGGGIDMSRAPITTHNIRVPLTVPEHADANDEYSVDGDSDEEGAARGLGPSVSLREDSVRHARRESMSLGGSTALSDIKRRRSVIKGIAAAKSLKRA